MSIIASFFLIFVKIAIQYGVASLQLPAKYTQLPALPIGQIETLIMAYRIGKELFKRGCGRITYIGTYRKGLKMGASFAFAPRSRRLHFAEADTGFSESEAVREGSNY